MKTLYLMNRTPCNSVLAPSMWPRVVWPPPSSATWFVWRESSRNAPWFVPKSWRAFIIAPTQRRRWRGAIQTWPLLIPTPPRQSTQRKMRTGTRWRQNTGSQRIKIIRHSQSRWVASSMEWFLEISIAISLNYLSFNRCDPPKKRLNYHATEIDASFAEFPRNVSSLNVAFTHDPLL